MRQALGALGALTGVPYSSFSISGITPGQQALHASTFRRDFSTMDLGNLIVRNPRLTIDDVEQDGRVRESFSV